MFVFQISAKETKREADGKRNEGLLPSSERRSEGTGASRRSNPAVHPKLLDKIENAFTLALKEEKSSVLPLEEGIAYTIHPHHPVKMRVIEGPDGHVAEVHLPLTEGEFDLDVLKNKLRNDIASMSPLLDGIAHDEGIILDESRESDMEIVHLEETNSKWLKATIPVIVRPKTESQAKQQEPVGLPEFTVDALFPENQALLLKDGVSLSEDEIAALNTVMRTRVDNSKYRDQVLEQLNNLNEDPLEMNKFIGDNTLGVVAYNLVLDLEAKEKASGSPGTQESAFMEARNEMLSGDIQKLIEQSNFSPADIDMARKTMDLASGPISGTYASELHDGVYGAVVDCGCVDAAKDGSKAVGDATGELNQVEVDFSKMLVVYQLDKEAYENAVAKMSPELREKVRKAIKLLLGDKVISTIINAVAQTARPSERTVSNTAFTTMYMWLMEQAKKYREILVGIYVLSKIHSFFTKAADDSRKLSEDCYKDDQYMLEVRKRELEKAEKQTMGQQAATTLAGARYMDLQRVLMNKDVEKIETLSDEDKRFYSDNAPALLGYMNYVDAVKENEDKFGGEKSVSLALMVGELIGRGPGDIPSGKLEQMKTDIRSMYANDEQAQRITQYFDDAEKLQQTAKDIVSKDPSSYMVVGQNGEVLKDKDNNPVPNLMKIGLAFAKEIENQAA
ncbi:MAG: hypothetical protein ABIG39_00885 [Candidatus Micrarchaeota archaeon]